MSIDTTTLLTQADLERLPDDGYEYELVGGELRRLNESQESSWVAGEILYQLKHAVRDRQLGWVYPVDAGFRCFPEDPDMVRKLDVAFVSKVRQPAAPAIKGFGRIVPDFVVEVVSPNDIAEEVYEKTQLWLGTGVKLVWVVWPSAQSVEVHTSEGSRRLRGQDVLDAHPRFSLSGCRTVSACVRGVTPTLVPSSGLMGLATARAASGCGHPPAGAL